MRRHARAWRNQPRRGVWPWQITVLALLLGLALGACGDWANPVRANDHNVFDPQGRRLYPITAQAIVQGDGNWLRPMVETEAVAWYVPEWWR